MNEFGLGDYAIYNGKECRIGDPFYDSIHAEPMAYRIFFDDEPFEVFHIVPAEELEAVPKYCKPEPEVIERIVNQFEFGNCTMDFEQVGNFLVVCTIQGPTQSYKGHGHIIHSGEAGVIQAASLALKKAWDEYLAQHPILLEIDTNNRMNNRKSKGNK